ncbi:MAG: site-specific integrase, partial [Halobacteriaceae archaeon]
CPHGREPANCEATNHSKLSCCPSSVSPHAIRRGSITCWLNNEMPSEAVGERANVTLEILKQHYDRRSEREKMEQRRKYLDNI